ncbi:MAG: DEAD/DEAH box helicase [Candidatus Parvarchaeota archaeon]|nr:DEAD/DEAH box helicase [Candidatus Parvarchaeota archaeon]
METSEIAIPDWARELLDKRIKKLTPPQSLAIRAGLFDGRNLVISSPTASGKTLIGELAMLRSLKMGRKAIYVAPMRAIATEKYEEFKAAHPYARCGLFIGDYAESDWHLDRYDFIFASTEKLDSMLRNSLSSFRDIGCIVYDEIHLLADPDRGPTLEFLITLNRELFPRAQVIALSATIENAEDLSKWLDAGLVRSSFRPVKIRREIYLDGELTGDERIKLDGTFQDPLSDIISWLIKDNKKAIIFTMTKKNAVSAAKTISFLLSPKLKKEEKEALAGISDDILRVLDYPTPQCEEEAALVRRGVAFHHAGLLNRQRKIIEDNFRDGPIRFICATPTLALGVNMPANTIIITSIYRFSQGGAVPIPKMEVEQMTGRAGRPAYDKEGTAVIISRTQREYDFIKEKYIEGGLEPILSSLGDSDETAKFTLALSCMGTYNERGKILSFFGRTFAGFLGEDMDEKVDTAVELLAENGLINGRTFEATRLGRLVNSLYLSPLTGILFQRFAEKLDEETKVSDLAVLHLLSVSRGVPSMSLKAAEYDKYEEESAEAELVADEKLVDYDRYVSQLKLAHILQDWIEEKTERYIEEVYGLPPGELYNLLQTIKWMAYGLKEIVRFNGVRTSYFMKLERRIIEGVKEELLPLISLPNIGRVRARKLYSNGFKTLMSIKEARLEDLSRILGKGIAGQVKAYLTEKPDEPSLKDI